MNFSAPSWDLFVALFLIVSIGYGFLMQRERIIVTMVAAYVGLVFAILFTPQVFGFFHGTNPLLGKFFIRANLDITQIQIGLFLLTTILVSTKAGLDAERSRGWLTPFELVLTSALTGILIAGAIIGFLPETTRLGLATGSKFVAYLVHYHDLAILAPIAFLVVLGLRDGLTHRPRL